MREYRPLYHKNTLWFIISIYLSVYLCVCIPWSVIIHFLSKISTIHKANKWMAMIESDKLAFNITFFLVSFFLSPSVIFNRVLHHLKSFIDIKCVCMYAFLCYFSYLSSNYENRNQIISISYGWVFFFVPYSIYRITTIDSIYLM